VAESNLHPAIHGPLILSCEVSTKALARVGDILGTGKTRISNDDIEEIKQVMSMLGVDADLSQDRTMINILNTNEYFEHLSVRDKGNRVSRIDEDFDNSVKQEIVERVYDNKNVDQQECDMIEKETEINHNRRNPVHEYDAGNGKEKGIVVKHEIDEDDCEIGDDDCDYSVKNFKVYIQELSELHDKTNHTDRTPEKEKLFKCNVCQYTASFRSVMKIHMRTHTGEKPYTCALCAKGFSQKTGLVVHMRNHTGEKPYICTVCSSAFSQKHHMRAHTRRHTGEKPYTCALCASAFRYKANLVVHMKKHTRKSKLLM